MDFLISSSKQKLGSAHHVDARELRVTVHPAAGVPLLMQLLPAPRPPPEPPHPLLSAEPVAPQACGGAAAVVVVAAVPLSSAGAGSLLGRLFCGLVLGRFRELSDRRGGDGIDHARGRLLTWGGHRRRCGLGGGG